MLNTIGNILTLTTFGESHGPAMGGVIDGIPAGAKIDLERVQQFVDRRRPGQSSLTTARAEDDRVEVLSGIFQGVTLGTPIGFIVRNKDAREDDYAEIKDAYRPCHADYTYDAKYGTRDYRGGGRASARETVVRVVAGAIAMQVLEHWGIRIEAHVSQVGDTSDPACYEQAIVRAQEQGDTLGGAIACTITGVPAGVGEPVFGKLHAALGAAMLSINAARAFEVGDGFAMASARGSEVMDQLVCRDGNITTLSNHSGGIQGGISNGAPITFNVAFKPIATLMRDVETINCHGETITLHPRGRHDVCVVPRAVPIVESMAALVVLDNMLMSRLSRL